MSATTDRLREIEAGTAPLPWPVEDFYDMPDDQFVMLVALSQAWPLLRDEIAELEMTVLALSRENAQFHSEHRRLANGAAALEKSLTDLRERVAQDAAESAEHTRILEKELDTANRQLAALPIRTLAAEAVCVSIDANKRGSGGAFGWYDGEAHDAWKKARG